MSRSRIGRRRALALAGAGALLAACGGASPAPAGSGAATQDDAEIEEKTRNPPAAPAFALTAAVSPAPSLSNSSNAARRSGAASGQIHVIESGETPTVIARKYGVKPAALMAANPKMDARRLQVGQTINVPMQ